MLELVLIVDPAARVRSASRSWSSFGVCREELVGEPLLTFVHPDDRAAFEPYLLRPWLARSQPILQARLAREGGWMPTVARLRPAPDGAALVVAVLPLEDAMTRTLEAERRAADQLRVIDEIKHRLIEATSHELRTPLTVLGGFGETLQRPDATFTPEDLRRIGESIQRHAARLERVVGDLVDLDRTAREATLTDVAPCDLGELVRGIVETHPLDDRPVHLQVSSVTARVDAPRFQRVVECLLDNVRRHTPRGTNVWVELTATEDGALLVVADDGPGLPPGLSGNAFSPFAQGGYDAASPGLGLGLAIVERFAELHGGRCWHTSREGGGSRFLVAIPRDGARRPAEPVDAVAPEVRGHATDAPSAADVTDTIRSVLATARRELGTRVAYLSRLTPHEQVIVETSGDGAALGIAPGERLALEDTYCARVVAGEVPSTIPDATREPAVAGLPATRAGLRAYVGVPVHLPSGHVFGTLCCADDQPREDLANAELSTLRALARVIGDELARHQVSVEEQRALTRDIERLLRSRDGLHTVYQPIVELRTGDVAGVEALSRFHDSQLRSPELWFADAARVGLAGELEQLAVLRALGGLAQLESGCYLSLNLSPDAIAAGGLRPLLGRVPLERIVIEITEHAAIADYERISTLVRPFRDGGARLAIDDVGAGFASLRHVLRMQPDIVKLDRSLVANVAAEPSQRAVAGAFGELAQRLGAQVVAEGIEDADTVEALLVAGITHGQGWYFARPGPLPLQTLRYDRGPTTR